MAKTRRASGEGSLYRLPDGRWRGQVFLGFSDAERKKRRYKIAEGRTQEEVRAKVVEILRLKNRGVDLNSPNVTLAQYLGQWMEDRVKRRVKPSTFEGYETIVKRHLVPGIGRIELRKLTPHDLQRLLNQKQDEGLSARTVRYIHSVLHSALNQALKWQLVDRNISEAVDLPRLKKFRVEPYTPEEARQLLQMVQLDRLFALYTLAISTGMRQGELLGCSGQTWI